MTCLTWYFMMVNHQNVFIWRSLGDLVGADAAAAAAADVSSAFGQSRRVVVYKPVEQRQKKREKWIQMPLYGAVITDDWTCKDVRWLTERGSISVEVDLHTHQYFEVLFVKQWSISDSTMLVFSVLILHQNLDVFPADAQH